VSLHTATRGLLLTGPDVTGIIIPKAVRFRIEFLPHSNWSHQSGSSGSGSASPSGRRSSMRPSPQHSPNPSIRSANGSVMSAEGMSTISTSMTMIQEKGALSAFKAVYGRIRAEWR
jgi:predicted lipid-binding transport protein (Tim44 family)